MCILNSDVHCTILLIITVCLAWSPELPTNMLLTETCTHAQLICHSVIGCVCFLCIKTLPFALMALYSCICTLCSSLLYELVPYFILSIMLVLSLCYRHVRLLTSCLVVIVNYAYFDSLLVFYVVDMWHASGCNSTCHAYVRLVTEIWAAILYCDTSIK